MSNSGQVNSSTLTRRQAIQIGAAGTAAGMLASERLAPPVHAKDPPPGPKTTAFVMPLAVYKAKPTAGTLNPVPTQAPDISGGECGRSSHQRETDWPPQKFYEMHVKEALHQFHPDLPTQKIWGYDGIYPGPTFVERYNVPVTVRIYNDLPANATGFGSPEITTHLHNLHDASESDGFTGDYYSRTRFGPTMTAAGAYKDHHYPNCYAGYDDPRYHTTDGDPREALAAFY